MSTNIVEQHREVILFQIHPQRSSSHFQTDLPVSEWKFEDHEQFRIHQVPLRGRALTFGMYDLDHLIVAMMGLNSYEFINKI